jgi:hypothetical protein
MFADAHEWIHTLPIDSAAVKHDACLQHTHIQTCMHAYTYMHAYTQLPPGWEKKVTPDGQEYYVNHNTKTTHWDPPEPSPLHLRLEQAQMCAT